MQMDSYLEIFTTMYGWAFANIIGEVITGTGLVVVPFAVIVFRGWLEAKEQGLQSAGVLPLLERVQTRLISALFVMSVCFATTPVTSLHHSNLSFTPQATPSDPSPQTASRNGGTASSFDEAMRDAVDGSMSDSGNLAFVPAWWYTAMAISSGFNSAVRAGVKNGGSEIRMVEDLARTITIEDPKVLQAVQRFYSECFIPARSRYLKMDKAGLSASGQALISADNADYGPSDVDWMGSQLFRTEPGFYADMRSYAPTPGFAVDFARDTDYYNPASGQEPPHPGVVNPEWGRPTCKQWWEDPEKGVRQQMISHSSGWQRFNAATRLNLIFKSEDLRIDAMAKLAQAKANPSFIDEERVIGQNYDTTTMIGRVIANAASTFGLIDEAFKASLAVAPLIVGLPMAQALLLMGLYMFLPLATFLSGFDLRVMFYGAVAIFTVKFWAVMWVIAQWIDARLISAMYPGSSGQIILQEFTHAAKGALPQGYKRMLLNILLLGLFIGLPLIWTAMMGWVGINIGGKLTELAKQSEGTFKNTAKSSASFTTKGRPK